MVNFKVNGLNTDTNNVTGDERIEPVVKYRYWALRFVLMLDKLFKKTVYIYFI